MRKTISITISGLLFHVEEQAYRKLDAYLGSIRSHFASYEDSEEIVSDIESRIAEKLSEKLSKGKEVISEQDVDELIARMGTVKDFAAFEGEEHTHQAEHTTGASRRFYRDVDNQLIAGVAAGLANYLGLDPLIIRGLFLLSLLFGGAGILVYIVLWILMPEAKTASERAEMRGQPLTLERIEATIRETVPEATKNIDRGAIERIVRAPFVAIRAVFTAIGAVLAKLLPFLLRVIGLGLLVGAIIALLTLTFWFLMLMTGSWEQYMDVPVRQLAGDFTYYVTLVSGYVVAFIPLLLGAGVGLSLLQWRNAFKFQSFMALIGVWMVALLTGAVTVAREAPAFEQKVEGYVEQHNTEISRDSAVQPFTSLEVSGRYETVITKGNSYAMNISGSRRAVEGVKMEVREDGTLALWRESSNHFCIFCIGSYATVHLTVPGDLTSLRAHAGASITGDALGITGETIQASGGARIELRDVRLGDTVKIASFAGSRVLIDSATRVVSLSLESEGGARGEFTGEAASVEAIARAGSRLTLSGTGTRLVGEVIAGSSLDALNFQAQQVEVKARAGGRAEVHALQELSASAEAGGRIFYSGWPSTLNVSDDPSGRIEPVASSLDDE